MASSIVSSHKRTKISRRHLRDDSIDTVVSYHHIHDDVLEYIFSFLPVKDAAKLGVLSKRFQKTWILSRKLCFGSQFVRRNNRDNYISGVNRVLENHAGPKIETLQLRFRPHGEVALVRKWIGIAIQKGLEELDLDFDEPTNPLKLSPEYFDIETLKILKLNNCQIEFPPKFKGLNLLHTFVLRRISITSKSLHALFYHCPCLEVLDLAYCTRISQLKLYAQNKKCFKTLRVGNCSHITQVDINAPTLRSFHYIGHISSLTVRDVTQLNDVMINIPPSRSFTCPAVLRNLVYHLTHIQVLTTTSVVLEALSRRFVDGQLREMPYCFRNLKEIQLFMEGATFCNMCDIVGFLQHCPSLQKIFIDLTDFTVEERHYLIFHQAEEFWRLRPHFGHLKAIKLAGYKFEKYELQLTKFLLQRAVNLEQLVLLTAKATGAKVRLAVMEKYCSHIEQWKASQRSTISLYQYSKDGSHLVPSHQRIWY